MKYFLLYVFLIITFSSCGMFKKDKISDLVNEWYGKEIIFPSHATFTIQGVDTICTITKNTQFKIVNYVDSTGCTGCKLQLPHWMSLINEVSGLKGNNVSFWFYFHPKTNQIKELKYILKNNSFIYPICIDEKDEFNKFNKLLNKLDFQTFLLDKDNRIIAIGNPIHNPKIKELYMNIILRNDITKNVENKISKVQVQKLSSDFGKFDWKHEMQTEFALVNTGVNPLVIADVSTSCGCTSVEYNKEPVKPGDELKLIVKYKADEPGHFSKSIKVFCNTKDSPISLKITGEALAN